MRTGLARDSYGNIYKYNLDTGERIDKNYQMGDGILDTIKSVSKKVATKLSGKAAKDIAQKAATKAVEKGAEQLGNKTGEIIANKLDSTFNKKLAPPQKNKGDQIREILRTHPLNKQYQQEEGTHPPNKQQQQQEEERITRDGI